MTAVTPEFQNHPYPHPEPVSSRVRRARETCSEALAELAAIQNQHQLSTTPGTRPTHTPAYWLGVLQSLTAYLLITLEEADGPTS